MNSLESSSVQENKYPLFSDGEKMLIKRARKGHLVFSKRQPELGGSKI